MAAIRESGRTGRQWQQGGRLCRFEAIEDRSLLSIVGDTVWHDLNANGVQDFGEPGIEGAVVEAFSVDDGLSRGVSITDSKGRYEFANLQTGVDYRLAVRAPAGYTFTSQHVGSNDALDSDVDQFGRAAAFTLSAGEDRLGLDAGLVGASPSFGFAALGGSAQGDYGQSVAIDAAGYIYLADDFQGTADFDPGPGEYELTSAGSADTLIAKYTPAGALVWARSIGGAGSDNAYGVIADSSGQVYVTGRFSAPTDFDPGPGAFVLTTGSSFVLKLDSSGNFIWAESFAGVTFDIDVASDGCVYVAGDFSGTSDFDPGLEVWPLTSAGGLDIYVLKLSEEGELIWAASMGGAGSDWPRDVHVNDDNTLLVAGKFSETCDFDPSPGVYNLASAGGEEAFVCKLEETGGLVWARALGGAENDQAFGVQSDSSGNVYAAGYFAGTADFDPGMGTAELTSVGGSDGFVVKLDPAGDFQWVRSMGSTSSDWPFGIAVSDEGKVYTAGFFSETVDFDPGPRVFALTSAGGLDVDISVLDSAGDFLFAGRMGSAGSDRCCGIALGADGSICTAGYINGTADFDPGPGTFALTGASNCLYVSKLRAASVEGRVWRDRDGDGVQDPAEPGAAGTVVEMFSTTDDVIGDDDDTSCGTAIADAQGYYRFDGYVDSLSYYLVFRAPVAYNFTAKNAGSNPTLDSDVDSVGRTAILTLGPYQHETGTDAGLIGNSPSFGWAVPAGAADSDFSQGVAVDGDSNIYMTGFFQDTVDFDPGPGLYNLVSGTGSSAFVAKYTSTGALVWARSFGGTSNVFGRGVTTDDAGNVYVAGEFTGTADFDPGVAELQIVSAGNSDAFVLKLTADGNLEWAKSMGGADYDRADAIDLSPDGHVLVTGWFAGTSDFDPGTPIQELTSAGDDDIFVCRLDDSGGFEWATAMGGVGTDHGKVVRGAADGSVYAAGYFSGVADFDPGEGMSVLSSAGGIDAFVVKLNSAGVFAWASGLGGSSSDAAYGVAVDDAGCVYDQGYFTGTVDFDPGAGVSSLTSARSNDAFVRKLDSNGNFLWARGMGGAGGDMGYGGLAVGSDGDVYSTGRFSGTADFDPGGGVFNLTSAGGLDVYLSKLNSLGDFVWAKQVGGSGDDLALSLALTPQGDVCITGPFVNTADFDPGAGSFDLTSAGGTDAYLLKLTDSFIYDPPPAVTSAPPPSLDAAADTLTITFSEPVNGGDRAENYRLQSLGPDALLGTADDELIPLSVSYAGSTATLSVSSLVAGCYRLTVTDALTDSADNPLDGDGDSVPGGAWTGDFVVLDGGDYFSTTNCDLGSSEIRETVIQTDGKIVAAGCLFNGSNNDFAITRFNPDGGLDASFGAGGKVTTAFPTNGSDCIYGLAVQPDGRIVAAGYSSNAFALARYNVDGSPDSTFGSTGTVTTSVGTGSSYAYSVALQPDGKIVLAGYAYVDTSYDFALVRYNTDGSLDSSFGTGGRVTTPIGTGNDYAYGVAVQDDGKIVAAGYATIGTGYDFALTRYYVDGSLDTTFDGDGRVTTHFGGTERAHALAIQSDGKILAAGYAFTGNAHDFALARYNVDGSLDTSLDGDGRLTTPISGTSDDYGRAVAFGPDGRVVVGGTALSDARNHAALVCYNADGSLDVTFNGDGKIIMPACTFSYDEARGVAAQSDGKVVVAGSTYNGFGYDVALARYNTDWSLDGTFGSDGKIIAPVGTNSDYGRAVAIRPDGKILLAGYASNGSNYDLALACFCSNGTPDTAFGSSGKVTTAIGANNDYGHAMAVQQDGRIVVAGATYDGSQYDFTLARYNSNGTLDASFDGDGKLVTPVSTGNGYAFGLAIQADGRIVVAGYAYVGSSYRFAVVRYNSDGSLDTTFGGAGIVTTDVGSGSDYAYGVAIQADGKIVVAGYGNSSFALVRYNQDGSLDASFDNDGKVMTDMGSGSECAYTVLVQPDGKIVAAGYAWNGTTYDLAVARYNNDGSLDTAFEDDGKLVASVGTGDDRCYASALKPDGTIVLAGQSYNGTNSDFLVAALAPTQGAVNVGTLSGRQFGVDACQWGAGQLVEGSGAPFDGLGRLQVGGADYKPLTACSFDDGGQTIITGTQAMFGLEVHREVTVPNSGSEDFARTVDVFYNPTTSPVTTRIRIVGNLGSDAATVVWDTFDGDTDIETTDRWIGTDDVDGSGTPAIVHYAHGPSGLLPESVICTGDNIEWTFNITVPAGQYVRLAHFTILADTRAAAEAAAATLVAADGFGGQASAFLTPAELATLLNFYNNSPPTIAGLSSSPDPVSPAQDVTLTATGVNDADPDGFVVSVAFYRESNGIPGLQTGGDGDTLLATDGNPADGWSTTFSISGLRGGTYTYYARATDNDGAQSATGTAAISTTNTVEAQYQIVSDVTATLTADPGQSVSFPVRYNTSTGDNTLPGLGLRMHFNSALLAYVGLSNVLPTPVQQQDPVADTADWDNDPTTDMYVFVSWADVGGNWPNQPLPVALYTATFHLSDGALSGAETAVRFSASSLAAGYTFESRPITVHARTITPSLDADGNGTVDALSDGILILRYLFDPAGTWNVNDALGSGATRTNQQQVKGFLDACTFTALDADGDNGADALSDGILILRYLFDPGGTWRIDDVLGPEATRTSREAIKAYLDQFNFAVSPAPGLMAAGLAAEPATVLPAEDLLALSHATLATNIAWHADADWLGAVVSQSLATGGTDTTSSVTCDLESSHEASQPTNLLAVDRVIQSWDQPAAEDVAVRWMRAPGMTSSDGEAARPALGHGDLDWFLADTGEAVNDRELDEMVLRLF